MILVQLIATKRVTNPRFWVVFNRLNRLFFGESLVLSSFMLKIKRESEANRKKSRVFGHDTSGWTGCLRFWLVRWICILTNLPPDTGLLDRWHAWSESLKVRLSHECRPIWAAGSLPHADVARSRSFLPFCLSALCTRGLRVACSGWPARTHQNDVFWLPLIVVWLQTLGFLFRFVPGPVFNCKTAQKAKFVFQFKPYIPKNLILKVEFLIFSFSLAK